MRHTTSLRPKSAANGEKSGRSPCPMVNTLANHGYLPRNGLNVSMSDLVAGLQNGVNLAEAATRLVGAKALTASTTGNPDTFNLDDLNRHGCRCFLLMADLCQKLLY